MQGVIDVAKKMREKAVHEGVLMERARVQKFLHDHAAAQGNDSAGKGIAFILNEEAYLLSLGYDFNALIPNAPQVLSVV